MAQNQQKTSKTMGNQKDPQLVEKELEDVGLIKPPDGGYGWVIVISSFLLNMIVDGVIFTMGKVLLRAWAKDFHISDAAASLTMSILSGCYFFIGPLASALCNVFGCRKVALSGSVIATIGFLLSIAAPNIYFLYITFGLIGGSGFGMMFLPAIVIISQYFATKRSLATGIAVCGSGIGTTIFAFLNDIVFDFVEEDWRKFLLYTAIVTICGFGASLLLRPLKITQLQIEKVAAIVENYEENRQTETEPLATNQNLETPFLSSLELHTAGKTNLNGAGSVLSIIDVVAKDVEELNRPLSRLDIFYSGSTKNLHVRSRANTLNYEELNELKKGSGARKEDCQQVYLSKTSLNGSEICLNTKKNKVKDDIIQALKNLLDSSLLASPSFLTLAVSGTLTLSCFYVPFIYLSAHLEKIQNLSTAQKSLPISLIGVLNIVARIGCGYIADRPNVSALFVNNVALFLAGVATFTVPFYTEYWHFLVFCIPFSIGVACFAALRSVICLELIGLDKLSNGFGILLTFMGVGAIIGSPIAAAVKDYTGNFDTSFYIMGSLMAISGLMCFPLPTIRQWELKRSTKAGAKTDVELEGLTENA